MKGHLGRLAAVLAAFALVAVGIFVVMRHDDPELHYIDMQRAASKASEEVGMNYWNNSHPESPMCSHHVIDRKGQHFWCQVLLAGHLVGVEMELTSPFGFFRVVKIVQNRELVAEGRREHQEFEEERESAEVAQREERESLVAERDAEASSWERHCQRVERGDWLQLCLEEAEEIRTGEEP